MTTEKEQAKEKHGFGTYCYVWERPCGASINCDNRCGKYSKEAIQEAKSNEQ